MAGININGLTKVYPNGVVAVRDVHLEVADGEFLVLVGPSGCGKSTLLRIMSGFIRQAKGRVLFDGEPVDHLTPSQRGVGIVFQNYALFPHMSVADNVAYGLQAHHWPREKIAIRISSMTRCWPTTVFPSSNLRRAHASPRKRASLGASSSRRFARL